MSGPSRLIQRSIRSSRKKTVSGSEPGSSNVLAATARAASIQVSGSAEDAFRVECELYHRLDRPDLKHPMRPTGTDWRCPVCGMAGEEEDCPDRGDAPGPERP